MARNLLLNGDFEDGFPEPWGTYGNVTATVVEDLEGAAVPEDPVDGDYALQLEVPEAGANFWDAGLQQSIPFEEGKLYQLLSLPKDPGGRDADQL